VSGILLGELNVTIKQHNSELTTPARFYFNYQLVNSLWLEIPTPVRTFLPTSQVEISTTGVLEPFEAFIGSNLLAMESGQLSSSLQIHPQRQPVESAPAQGLREVAFGLMDCPFPRLKPLTEASVSPLTFSCGQFDVTVGPPLVSHIEIAKTFGSLPRTLTHSCVLKEHDGKPFDSEAAKLALDTSIEALSFAAGRWIAVCMVEGRDENNSQKWFRWGTTKISEPVDAPSWFDLASAKWLSLVANGLLNVKADEQVEEILHTALY
jgi:hypothetical protein